MSVSVSIVPRNCPLWMYRTYMIMMMMPVLRLFTDFVLFGSVLFVGEIIMELFDALLVVQ